MGVVRFDEIAKESRDTFKGKVEGMPIVGLEHIEPYDMLLSKWDVDVETTFTKEFHKGQIMFGRRRAYQHKACVATCDGICSGDITLIEPIEGMVCPDLLPFIVQNDDFFEHAIKGSNGALSPRVKWQHMANFEINLSSLSEQKVLAEKLWAAYDVKQSYLKMIEATEEMVKSQFVEMFGDNYNGWKYPVIKLGEQFSVGTGGTPDRKIDSYYKGNIPWVKSTEVNYCELSETEEHISEQAIKDSNCTLYPPLTILLAMYGQGTTRGRVAILRTNATVNQAIAAIKVENETESLFLYHLLKVCYDFIRKLAVGGNQHNLNLKLVSSIPIISPPTEFQRQFVSIAHQADISISELRKSIDAIDKVIKSLINENL